jgi:hypothetical protein
MNERWPGAATIITAIAIMRKISIDNQYLQSGIQKNQQALDFNHYRHRQADHIRQLRQMVEGFK